MISSRTNYTKTNTHRHSPTTHKKKDGSGGSYRLASLDRLATRQRILEQNGGNGIATVAEKAHENGGAGGGQSNGGSLGGGGGVPYSVSKTWNGKVEPAAAPFGRGTKRHVPPKP